MTNNSTGQFLAPSVTCQAMPRARNLMPSATSNRWRSWREIARFTNQNDRPSRSCRRKPIASPVKSLVRDDSGIVIACESDAPLASHVQKNTSLAVTWRAIHFPGNRIRRRPAAGCGWMESSWDALLTACSSFRRHGKSFGIVPGLCDSGSGHCD